jgi:hypothetical protein
MGTVPWQVYRGNARGIQSHHNPDDGDIVPETSVSTWNQLTRLCARENFIEFSRRESFKFYIINRFFLIKQGLLLQSLCSILLILLSPSLLVPNTCLFVVN